MELKYQTTNSPVMSKEQSVSDVKIKLSPDTTLWITTDNGGDIILLFSGEKKVEIKKSNFNGFFVDIDE